MSPGIVFRNREHLENVLTGTYVDDGQRVAGRWILSGSAFADALLEAPPR